MATITLNNNRVALVDDVDIDRLSAYRWRAIRIRHTWYAVRNEGDKLIYMHREILQAPSGLLVDHRNNDGLDNRRCNLRLATQSQNHCNARPRRGCRSRYPGVDWNKNARAWRARAWENGREVLVGYFKKEEEAAEARAKAAKRIYGEFARCNFEEVAA